VSNGRKVSAENVSINSVSNCKNLSKSGTLSDPGNLKTFFCQTRTTFPRAITIGYNVPLLPADRVIKVNIFLTGKIAQVAGSCCYSAFLFYHHWNNSFIFSLLSINLNCSILSFSCTPNCNC